MIQKISIRNQVKDILIDHIVTGQLEAEQKLSLADLSRMLGISATPIREALTQLEETGIVEYRMNVGFFIKKITLNEAEDIYTTIGFLEGLAVRASEFSTAQIKKLKRLQSKMQMEHNPVALQKIDYQFHQVLIQTYTNKTIKNIIENLKASVFINELKYMESDFVKSSPEAHLKIIRDIEKNKLQDAAEKIVSHWADSYHFLLAREENF